MWKPEFETVHDLSYVLYVSCNSIGVGGGGAYSHQGYPNLESQNKSHVHLREAQVCAKHG